MKSKENKEKAIDEIVKIIKDFQYNDELRHQIYMLGLYNYRQFHKVGISKDFKNPRILEESLKD